MEESTECRAPQPFRSVGPLDLRRIDELTPVRDDVWMLGLTIPRAQPKYSICYVIMGKDGGLHLIDPGLDLPENRATLEGALSPVGGMAAVRSIIATHLHFDHIGLADWLRRRTGAFLQIHERDAGSLDAPADDGIQTRLNRSWGVPPWHHRALEDAQREAHPKSTLRADASLSDGDLVPIPGRNLRVLATPGHTTGHLCIIDEDRRLAFTGDLVLPGINPGFGLDGTTDGDALEKFLASLQSISSFDAHEACPGHEHRFVGLRERSAQIAEHHLRQNARVARVLEQHQDATVWEIARAIPRRVSMEDMAGGYLRSVLLQVATHVEFIRKHHWTDVS